MRKQQIVLRPVIKLFKAHQIVIAGDREFHSIDLAQWISRQGVKFVLREKKTRTFACVDQILILYQAFR